METPKQPIQNQAVNLLDKVSADDLEKIREHQASTEGASAVDNEWMLLGEFAKAYGWQAYNAAKNDEISMSEMLTLIEVSRKLQAHDQYLMAEASFVGSGSVRAKNPSSAFRSLTKGIIKRMKVQD